MSNLFAFFHYVFFIYLTFTLIYQIKHNLIIPTCWIKKKSEKLISQINHNIFEQTSPKLRASLQYLSRYQYKLIDQIGRGGYGIVYKVSYQLKHQQKQYAMKINFNTVSQEVIFSEIGFLTLAKNSRNLPKLTQIFIENNITHIVMEYFDFKPFITFFKDFTIDDTKHYMYELLLGLNNLKSLGIYHRDIKPGNFLYNPQKKRGMIVDFGLAQVDPRIVEKLQQKLMKMKEENKDTSGIQENIKIYKRLIFVIKAIGKNKIGTQTYMPLQSILKKSEQSYETQIWSAGVIFLQLLTKKFTIFSNFKIRNKPSNVKNHYFINYIIELSNLFGTNQVINQCQSLGYQVKLPSDIPSYNFKHIISMTGYNEIAEDLLSKMLCLCPENRISIEEALRHQFFDNIRQFHPI